MPGNGFEKNQQERQNKTYQTLIKDQTIAFKPSHLHEVKVQTGAGERRCPHFTMARIRTLEVEFSTGTDEEGVQGLAEANGTRILRGEKSKGYSTVVSWQCRTTGLLILLSIGLLLVIFPWVNKSGSLTISGSSTMKLDFRCPRRPTTSSKNLEDDSEAMGTYLGPGKQPIFDEHFLETFRDTSFDGWNHPFTQLKERKYDWKARHFASLTNGSRIFESACGLGLNLFMTLEIMHEMTGLRDITVYGNEYISENAAKANSMLQVLFKNQSVGNMVGGICQADSTDLSWVSPDQMDLVFTGYLSPLWDPLELDLDFNTNYEIMKALCVDRNTSSLLTEDGHWMEAKLTAIAQKRQEDWVSSWVEEMVRIAKPGAPVIIEEIAAPLCDILHDYGGVSFDFWKTGSEVYGWDIDAKSLDFAYKDDKKRRYNVFMKKNEAE